MKRLLVDRTVCTACRTCEAICSMVHYDGLINPRKSRIRISQNIFQGTSNPVVCKQCKKAPCIRACSKEAMYQDEVLKYVIIDSAKCDSCMACVEACPFGAMFYDEERCIPLVCDLCGGDPMCVKFCRHYPHNSHATLRYGDGAGTKT